MRKLGAKEVQAGAAAFQARAQAALEARGEAKSKVRRAGEVFLREAILRSYDVKVEETKLGLRVTGEHGMCFDVVVIPR